MVEILISCALAACALGGLAILRLWTMNRPGRSLSALTPLFCLWIVSTVVWNTYYKSIAIPGMFDMSIERALLILLIFLALFQFFLGRVNISANYSVELAFVVFLVICVASMGIHGFNAYHPDFPRPFFIFLFSYVTPFLAFLFVKYYMANAQSYRLFFSTLFLLGIYLCVTAALERNDLHQYIYPQYITSLKYTMHLDRARGPFLNAAFNGVGMTIGFIAGILLLRHSGTFKRLAILILLALFFPGIFYTHTRSIYLIFLYCLFALLFFYRTYTSKWKAVPLVLFLCISFIAADFKHIFSESREGGGIAQMEEVAIRFQLIERSKILFSSSPLFGVGLAQFSAVGSSPEFFHEQQHNHILGMAVELGLVGVSSYLFILLLIFYRLYSLASNPLNNTIDATNVLIMLTLAITINLINNVFVEPSYCPFVNILTFSFAGIIDRLHESPDLLHTLCSPANSTC